MSPIILGSGAEIGGGALALFSGLKTGGARGGLGAAGGAAAIVGGILPLLSSTLALAGPIGAAVGGALALASTLFGDPKQNRANQISRTLSHSQFFNPVALNVTEGFGGGLSDYDRFGGNRSSSLSPFPIVEEPYADYRHNVLVPGRTLGNFGGPSGVTNLTIIHAMDAQSFAAFAKGNSNAIIDGVIHGMEMQGRHDLVEKIRPLL